MPNRKNSVSSLNCHHLNHANAALASLSWAAADDLIDRALRSDVDDGELEFLTDIRGCNPISHDEMNRLWRIARGVRS